MKYVGTRDIKVASIVLPGPREKGLEMSVVGDLAGDFREDEGQLVPIAIRRKDSLLLWGRHRLAAARRADVTEVRAELWECSDEEIPAARLHENLHRHVPATAEVIAKAVAETASRLGDSVADSPGPGPRTTPRGAAREKVAEAAGMKPRSVARADQRAAKKAAPVAPAVDLHGLSVPPMWMDGVRGVQDALDTIDRYGRDAQATAARLAKLDGWGEESVQKLRALAKDLAATARYQRPVSICLYCKHTTGMGDCPACRGLGWLRADQMTDVPKELLREGAKAVVSVGGKFVPYTTDEDIPY